MKRRIAWLLVVALVAILGAAIPARANFHIMMIRETLGGVPGNPNVQFVELQMYAGGQNQVQGHPVRIYNATGTVVGTFTFGAAVPNGASQAFILVATADAQTYFGVTANLVMTPVMTPAGGAACFDSIDCVSWGNFTGTLPSPAGAPFNPTGGLVDGQSAERKISGGTRSSQLDAGDDTNNSATDFQLATPTPTNNAGVTGSPSGTALFSADTYVTSETAGSVTLTVQRGATTQSTSATYATVNGTATAGQDYTSTAGTLSFGVGESSKTFAVPILDDGVLDGDEQFTVTLDQNGNQTDTATVIICGNLPGAPRSLAATPSGTSTINLSWLAPTCAGDSAISSYKIYGGSAPNPTTVLANVPAGQTTYSHTGLAPSSTRYYRVSAVSGAGEGAQSNQAQATTASNDTQNPTVTFTTPNNSVIVAGSPAVTGTAHDDVTVSNITAAAYNVRGLKERDLTVSCTGCGTANAQFTVPLSGLLPGVYLIRVIAKDQLNKSGSAELTVVFVS